MLKYTDSDNYLINTGPSLPRTLYILSIFAVFHCNLVRIDILTRPAVNIVVNKIHI